MEQGTISVDRWSECSQVYFLTHLHADHTQGLSPNWRKGPLFCSSITAKLFPAKFPGFDLSLLRVLEIGSTYSLSVVSPSSGSQVQLRVIAIDAVHCPGAVMFLFHGDFGRVLYTGDFRWEGTSERALLGKSMLLNAIGSDKIDILYLDNTYCHPSYTFPPREVVAQQVVDIIAAHPDHDIVIAINTLGKEDLLLRISRALKTKIWVWPERLQTMHLLGFQDIFTTESCLTRVRAIPFYSFSIETLEELNLLRPTIGIMPSGLPWLVNRSNEDDSLGSPLPNLHDKSKSANPSSHRTKNAEKSSAVRKYHRYMYSVPYSDHSCFDELLEFIKLVQPSRMKGIVTSSSSYIDPVYHLGHLCGSDRVAEQSSEKLQRPKKNSVVTYSRPIDLSVKKRYLKLHNRRTSRVSILRRLKRGVRIVETLGIE